ncbi:MAG: hypothetical protein JSV08_01090 [Acidobacteriota bacterium]|nr:MAG: hypothetical protein JSV08_01090 [Acidobacteriota bacterium]
MAIVLMVVVIVGTTAVAVVYLIEPFLHKERVLEDELRMRHDQFVWEKNVLLQGLKELEMDYRMQKLSEEDYGAHRELLLARAAERIARIEAVKKEAAEREIELEVARVRAARSRTA